MTEPLIVAIDGPGGSGKSTVGRLVGAALGLEVLDTGAMYRAVTLCALQRGVPLDDGDALGELAEQLELEVGNRVFLDGHDVTEAIRSGAVTAAVSQVASWPKVRAALVQRQRSWVAARNGAVVEGRDIASVVFPDAQVKVYLTASEGERARRRHAEVSASSTLGLDATRSAIARRDSLDSNRAASPLVVADGAVVIDSTDAGPEDVVRRITDLARAVSR